MGFLPRAPATVASIFAGLAWFLLEFDLRVQLIVILVLIALGQMSAASLTRAGDRDPQYIVIDEAAGVWVALAGIAHGGIACATGTIAFRVLDRFKPRPISTVERRGGGFALMGDDIVAGLVANGALRATLVLYAWLT